MNASLDFTLRHGMPIALAAICLYSAPQFLKTVSWTDVVSLIGALPIWIWITAILFTAVSFAAIGQYDILARRHLRLPGSDTRTHQNGMIAIALSQVLGFGLLTGSLVRYRLRPGDGMLRSGQITAIVTAFFLTGLLFVTVFAIAISGMLIDRLFSVSAFVGLVVCAIYLTVFRPKTRLWQKQISIPGVFAVTASISWAALDVLAAAAAFYVLLPAGAEVTFFSFLPVFCIALAAGIVSGAPGGVGPFELVLLGLTIPDTPAHIHQTSLLTAIFAFRFIYYLLPAVIGAFFVFRPGSIAQDMRPTPLNLSANDAPRAETAVISQNGGSMVQLGSGAGALWPAGNSLVSLFDPTALSCKRWFRDFRLQARSLNLLPVMYKCSARHAAAARKQGWSVVKVANDAILNPVRFELKGSKLANLRRKLRKATNAGVTIELARPDHLLALARIDNQWQLRCGGARGGTMGRFCPEYLGNQLVLVAEKECRPIAFISLHQGQREWALDLMRDDLQIPDGTMYLLVHRAIELAREARIESLSLAAVPTNCGNNLDHWTKPLNYIRGKWAAKGLYQFKSAFAPNWKPLYMATPGKLGLCIATMDILREVLRPDRLQT